jgi:LacI family transcriptional regulator
MPSSRKSKKPHAATLADVGREAGVSAMAASAVLNGARTSSRFSEGTRARIIEAAQKLQYRPNAAARALVHRRMNSIGIVGVIEEDELNHYFLAVFNGILAESTHRRQNAAVFSLRNWADDAVRLHSFCDGRIDGMVLIAPTIDATVARQLPTHTPFVSVHSNAQIPGVVNIESDEEHGAFAMVEALIARGHRRIMHIAGPEGYIGADRRVTGYKAALKKHDLRFESRLLMHTRFDTLHGREAMSVWLRQHAGEALPHAIFCANDMIALGVMEALADVGLQVPHDISVAGFDDTLAARTTSPQLASVRQPLVEMGRLAADTLLARIESPEAQPQSPIVLPVEVVMRGSVGERRAEDRLAPPAGRH